jgi:hypothetical protein
MSIPQGMLDERFLMHRLRATSLSGIAGGSVAMALFAWHWWRQHIWSWELLSIGITMAVVKQALMAWYRFRN